MTRAEALGLASVHYLPLPDSIHGATRRAAGGYLIAINSTMSAEAQAQTLEHELAHIRLDHFNSEASIEKIEAEAEALVNTEIKKRRPVG